MRIEQEDLDCAVSSDILSQAQACALWEHFGRRSPTTRDDEGSCSVASPLASTSRRSLLRTIVGSTLAVVLTGAAVVLSPDLPGWHPSPFERALLCALAGVAILGVAFWIDGGARRELAGSLYLAGLTAIVGAVATAGEPAARSSSENVGSPGAAGLVGAALVLLGLALRRRSFAIFGALALAGAAGHLADEALEDAAFSFVLAAVALAFVAAALAWRRAATPIGDALLARLPVPVRRALESRRGPLLGPDPDR